MTNVRGRILENHVSSRLAAFYYQFLADLPLGDLLPVNIGDVLEAEGIIIDVVARVGAVLLGAAQDVGSELPTPEGVGFLRN